MAWLERSVNWGTEREMGAHGGLVGLLATCLALLVATCAATPAAAVAADAQWTITGFSIPTNVGPGSGGTYTIDVRNTGDASSHGTIAVAAVLPTALKAVSEASGYDYVSGNELTCTGLTCEYTGVVVPGDFLVITLHVEAGAGAHEEVVDGMVSVAGGGAPESSREVPITISAAPANFGVAPGSVATTLSDVQAGAHADLTAGLVFNTKSVTLAGKPKELVTDLPPGFVGDLADTPRCSIAAFSKEETGTPQKCSLDTQVGTAAVFLNGGFATVNVIFPVYNLTTNPGEIAKLGFFAEFIGVQGTISVRPGDYGVRTTFQGINDSKAPVGGASLTIWGVPSDPSHDAMRGLACLSPGSCGYYNTTKVVGGPSTLPDGQPSEGLAVPYLTSPTDCTGAPLTVKFFVASWENPGRVSPDGTPDLSDPNWTQAQSNIGPLTGCDLLEFGPFITAAPDTTRGDTPAGFTFDVKVPEEGLVNPAGLSAADIENTTVTLPPGVVVNPGQAAGLGVCKLSQAALETQGPPSCPSDSKVGQVEVETPILRNKLKGDAYLLQSNPPTLKLLVAPEDRPDGIYVKLVGNVHLDEGTGRLVTTFEKTPELPFNDFKLSFSGGAQAALATPTGCGAYSTDSDFAPWSKEGDVLATSSFAIETGPDGQACASPLPFGPSLIAGATTDQAGGFTHFSLLLQRADGQQRISTLQFKTPPGLLGRISKVVLCGETEAANDACPEGSQIGHTVVEAGPGPYPLVVPQPGSPPAPIYLTGPYDGAPYGLLIKVPLLVGPFDLGTEVVRSKIEVDPITAQLTVTTGKLPAIIKGVPSDLRTINAVIDRPEFMFNPTNCAPMAFGGTATSTEGATAGISSRFEVGSCQVLKFKPVFHASTSGKTSRASGTGLDVKLSYPKAPWGTQTNIAKVKVDLPKQLPSRLTTLQKACTDTVFDANPSACPSGSRVGEAIASTPVLPGTLSGPAYFVSHGGQKFPELVIVLQGAGVTVDLHGETFITKTGITSSTFRQVPDVPIGTFELKLPQGSHSALAANGNLCRSKLRMPTAFTAQNGLVVHQSTPITVTGCPKLKVKKAAGRHQKGTK